MKWAGNVARMGEMRNTYKSLVGKPEGKRPLRTSRHILDLRGVGWKVADWMHLARERDQWRALVNTV